MNLKEQKEKVVKKTEETLNNQLIFSFLILLCKLVSFLGIESRLK